MGSQNRSPAMTTDSFDLDRRLAAREEQNLRRDLESAQSVASQTRFADAATAARNDERADTLAFGPAELVFASNNYLGLASDDRVQAGAADAAQEFGTGAGASRLITGDTTIHHALERELAACKGTAGALLFSSGYAANVGTISALDPDRIFSDELNHASIIDGCQLAGAETRIYDHCDAVDLAECLAAAAADGNADEDWLIVTDSVFSMDGDIAPLADICALAEEYGAWVMVDEAHATGLFGADAGGVVQERGLGEKVHVQMGTLSKALGSQGGYVAGSETLVEYLVNDARSFVFSTGLAPPAVGAAREALQIAREGDRPAHLWATVDRLRAGLEAAGFEVLGSSHILPVLVGDRDQAVALADRVRERGVVAPAIRPPTVPDGTSRIRVAPMATHDRTAVEQCLDAFRDAGREVGVIE